MSAREDVSHEEIPLGVWDPDRYVRPVDAIEARLSRGFLRCRPERWFPGFAAQWLPLAHSLGLDPVVQEVRPAIDIPGDVSGEGAFTFLGSVDDEQIVLHLDQEGARVLVDAFCPTLFDATQGRGAASVLLEYLSRRLLTTLVMAWTGPQPEGARYLTEGEVDPGGIAGGVEIKLALNGRNCSVWIGVGSALAGTLDGLWRRQLASSLKGHERTSEISIEIAQLAVPPSMLVEYTRKGTIVDLEVPITDTVVLRQGGKPWLSARLCNVRGMLGFETVSGQPPAPILPEGTTRLSLQFGSCMLDPTAMLEIAQPGAIYESDIELNDSVRLVINGEKVADATLCTYEGRFAVSVN